MTRPNSLLSTLLTLLPLMAAADFGTCYDNTGEKRPYYGDLHVHTMYSMDAYIFGNRQTPADAYRFAKGQPEVLADGTRIALDRRLDFAAVTDHGEYFSITRPCGTGSTSEYCRELNESSLADGSAAFRNIFLPLLMQRQSVCPEGPGTCETSVRDAWLDTQSAAHDAYDRCEFTTFVGSEWSPSPGNLHWHRNHIYAGTVVPDRPIDVLNEADEITMWRALRDRCLAVDGCDVIAIPHNSNLGLGGSFQDTSAEGLELRARLESLAEIHQHKGQSECFPGSPYTDDACNFEVMYPIPLAAKLASGQREPTAAELESVRNGYLRDTLARGLALGVAEGINPFRYGFIGSTDTHGARPGYVEESGWQGTVAAFDRTEAGRDSRPMYNPGGLAAVWALENTREAIFDALKRRETFATSGPRIALRFQQTFDSGVGIDLCNPAADGVTVMGETFDVALSRPRFAVIAKRDHSKLARIDIVKLALVAGEVTQTVHSFTPSYPRDEWCVTWEDDAFTPGDAVLWYARVLEVPTKRWNYRDSNPQMIQERAWSSPIWSL